jgi:hypothetical protein
VDKPTHWRFQDLEGRRFDRLLVTAFAGRKGKKVLWRCRCDCGGESIAFATSLTAGKHRSCGCLQRETVTSHGRSHSPEYRTWAVMNSRCHRANATGYDRYGGRGIAVCDRWRHSFENFLADMGERPTLAHTIERKDVDGPYSPENCVWATRVEQADNTTRTRRYTHNGETLSMTRWAVRVGLKPTTLRNRLDAGMSFAAAIAAPAEQVTTITHDGRTLTAGEWEAVTGIASPTIRARLQRGWTAAAALTTPVGG